MHLSSLGTTSIYRLAKIATYNLKRDASILTVLAEEDKFRDATKQITESLANAFNVKNFFSFSFLIIKLLNY